MKEKIQEDCLKHKEDYIKIINLDLLCKKDIDQLEETFKIIGYLNNSDYKFNWYNTKVELVITNKSLHKLLKIIRKTKYTKVWKD